jgi:hypothetical protein
VGEGGRRRWARFGGGTGWACACWAHHYDAALAAALEAPLLVGAPRSRPHTCLTDRRRLLACARARVCLSSAWVRRWQAGAADAEEAHKAPPLRRHGRHPAWRELLLRRRRAAARELLLFVMAAAGGRLQRRAHQHGSWGADACGQGAAAARGSSVVAPAGKQHRAWRAGVGLAGARLTPPTHTRARSTTATHPAAVFFATRSCPSAAPARSAASASPSATRPSTGPRRCCDYRTRCCVPSVTLAVGAWLPAARAQQHRALLLPPPPRHTHAQGVRRAPQPRCCA